MPCVPKPVILYGDSWKTRLWHRLAMSLGGCNLVSWRSVAGDTHVIGCAAPRNYFWGQICFGKTCGRSVGPRILLAVRWLNQEAHKRVCALALALLRQRHSRRKPDADSSEQEKEKHTAENMFQKCWEENIFMTWGWQRVLKEKLFCLTFSMTVCRIMRVNKWIILKIACSISYLQSLIVHK